LFRKTIRLMLALTLAMAAICSPGAAGPPSASFDETVATKISFDKTDLLSALKQLALAAGYNLVASPDVHGDISITLTDVTYEQALKIIAQSRGYVCEQEGNCIYVGRPGQVLTDQNTVVFFPVYYADPKQVAELLKKILNTGEQIISDDRSRMILVKGSQALREQVETIIGTLDRKMPQITVEVKVIAVSTTALQKMGMELARDNSSLNWAETSSGVQIILNMISNGHTWNVIFKNLLSHGQARLITSPSVSTMNGQEASIIIADKIPIETSDEDGNINVNYIDVGIKLVFTPFVQRDDELVIDLNTQVGSLGDKMGSSYKIISKEVKSRIQAKIGETVFLGGLISHEEQNSHQRIPKLADIPLFGKIFQNKENYSMDNELIITFTPRWNNSSYTSNRNESNVILYPDD
jgi:type IV pilus assembly protein PilQ